MGQDKQARINASAQILSRILGCSPHDLPTLPSTAMELLDITNRPDASADDLVKLVSRDPSVAARLLRMANSPVYIVGEPVTDLTRAVVVLGFAEIARLAVAISVLTAAGGDKPIRRRMQRLRLWDHCQVVGTICEILGRDVLDWGRGYYIYGLIHDIGKVALDSHRPETFTGILNAIDKQCMTWVDAENQALMVDHGFVGLSLMTYWEMPEEMIQAVGHHHDPWEAGEQQDVAGMVFLADYLAKSLGHFSFDAEKKIELASTIDERMSEFLKSRDWALTVLKSPDLRTTIEEKLAKLAGEGS